MRKEINVAAKSECKKLTKPFEVSKGLLALIGQIEKAGGKPILVGGCVRDHLLGKKSPDIDIEVYGLSVLELENALSKNFTLIFVGKSFGIIKVISDYEGKKETFDVSLPRLENKEGQGHKGFIVTTNPFLSFKESAKRRDFTINAMGIDLSQNLLIDPYNGYEDLQNNLLKHVSKAFSEDPLRVLRAAQFCARFGLTLDKATIALCIKLKDELLTLSKERIFGEFKKLLLAPKPSIGLALLRETKALILFPELFALIDCAQDNIWHPEGDVWIHSLMVTDEAALLAQQDDLNEEEQLIIVMGALCHDLGKPKTTVLIDGRIKSPAHEQVGEAITLSFLEKVGFPKKYYEDVTSLVKEHLKPFQLYKERDKISDSAIRRLANRVDIRRLLYVSRADFLGRTTHEALSKIDPSYGWLKTKANELAVMDEKPKPILLGRHLIALGEKPSALFTSILREGFEAQMDGVFSDEKTAIEWLKKRLAYYTKITN